MALAARRVKTRVASTTIMTFAYFIVLPAATPFLLGFDDDLY